MRGTCNRVDTAVGTTTLTDKSLKRNVFTTCVIPTIDC